MVPWEILRLGAESAGLGVWEHNRASGVLRCSRRAKVIFGLDTEPAIDYPLFLSRVHPDDRERVAKHYGTPTKADGLRRYDMEFRTVSPDGGTRWVLAWTRSWVERPDGTKQIGRVVGAALDITDRKQAEHRAHESWIMESLRRMAGGLAHEFNNLLTGVIGNATIMAERLAPGSKEEASALNVIDAGNRMAHLTAQLLAYSGQGLAMSERLDLHYEVIRALPSILKMLSPHVEFKPDLEIGLPRIAADSAQVQQVLLALVENAVEAIGEAAAGTIEIQTRLETVGAPELLASVTRPHTPACEYVKMLVRDTGCGMDDHTRTRIFDPFFSTKFMGRGLALAAVLGIVRAHEGLLTVESSPGAGATLSVYWPLARRR